ncbi:AbrB family transcriptional regulator [Noviherbaspirillum sp. CPCC 100848]|uniref:AbrB family transcriptional regulator n=1 Tax=Noviherbaspirillum album TaxID=3080276 RepID=A0ABU6JAB6_9BURK|nr:AbrB family transcriptional regulator [Noviherbaspirillum sp. CPCC 100848]MEC4720593.1 AbrB family transcriptional regulator [Noviherbaspirillum sp. CPCC 100848]
MAFLKNRQSFLLALGIGLVAALLCAWLQTPLPWMIGPLCSTAAACMAGLRLSAPVQVREGGQWAIGTALGLYFTPAVVKVLVSYVGFIAAGVAFALLLGAACAWLLHKLSGVDRTTAFFAMAIGGASEMASQGERHGAQVDRVAASHSLRIMMVVIIIPFLFKFAGVHGLDVFVPGARVVHAGGLLALIALTSLGALLFKRLKSPNAWVLGPMAVAIVLTASGFNLSALPEWMVHLGQLFIGISLGTRFTPEFLHTAPRYLASVALCTLAALGIAAGFAFGLSSVSGIHPATAILATSPGGIAEMSLTAKTLQLGVPIVTAFHVTRLASLVIMIGPLFRLGQRWRYGRK